MNFNEANKKMHPAETGCWAHGQLVEAGFSTNTSPQQGLVRTYEYTHPNGTTLQITTGFNADYWRGTYPNGNSIPQFVGYGNPPNDQFTQYHRGLDRFLRVMALTQTIVDNSK